MNCRGISATPRSWARNRGRRGHPASRGSVPARARRGGGCGLSRRHVRLRNGTNGASNQADGSTCSRRTAPVPARSCLHAGACGTRPRYPGPSSCTANASGAYTSSKASGVKPMPFGSRSAREGQSRGSEESRMAASTAHPRRTKPYASWSAWSRATGRSARRAPAPTGRRRSTRRPRRARRRPTTRGRQNYETRLPSTRRARRACGRPPPHASDRGHLRLARPPPAPWC